MSDNDRVRASINATLDEILPAHSALGLPIDKDDFLDAWEIIERIEARLQEVKASGWINRWK